MFESVLNQRAMMRAKSKQEVSGKFEFYDQQLVASICRFALARRHAQDEWSQKRHLHARSTQLRTQSRRGLVCINKPVVAFVGRRRPDRRLGVSDLANS